MRIVQLTADNVKRLKAVQITPDSDLVLVTGENGAGKSSTLDSIEMALRGKTAIPNEPIHRGAKAGRVVLDLGDLVVERTFTPGGSRLVVRGADGVEQRSPQTLLDALVSRVSFDPLEFATMPAKEQDRVLREVVGIDHSSLDQARKAAFDQRTEVNRDVKRLTAQLEALPFHEGVPTEEQDGAQQLAELNRLNEALTARNVALANIEMRARRIAESEAEVERLKLKLADLLDEIESTEASIATGHETVEAEKRRVADLPDHAAAIEERMRSMRDRDAINRKVRENSVRLQVEQELAAQQFRADGYSATIASIDRKKTEELEAAKYPIPGLALAEAGVMLDGFPFEQASTSRKIRASVAIGAALNPELRVLLVRRGNDLDRERLKLVAEMAAELDMQIWCERIETGGLPAVVIEDGEVAEQEAPC